MSQRPTASQNAAWMGEAAAELRLFQQLRQRFPDADPGELAALLGLNYQPVALSDAPETTQPDPDIRPRPPIPEPRHVVTGYPPAEKDLPFLAVTHRIAKAPLPESDRAPEWYQQIPEYPGRFTSEMTSLPDPEPLVRWEQFWPRLHKLFGDENATRRLNERTIIRHAVERRPLTELPWQRKIRWPEELVVIVDFSPHLVPYYADFKALVEPLLRWFRQRLRLIICVDAERAVFREGGRTANGFPEVGEGSCVLYLGDLGALDRHGGSRVRWIDFGRNMQRRRARLEAFLCVAEQDWRRVLARDFRLHALEGASTPSLPGQSAAESPATSEAQTEALLAWLSPALEISLPMLRQARRLLGFHVSVESLVCQHRALIGKARIYQWRTPAQRRQYREQFTRRGYALEELWPLIESYETTLPVELQAEQRQQIGRSLHARQTNHLRRLLKWQHASELGQDDKNVLFDWVASMARRALDEPWSDELTWLFGLYWRHCPETQRVAPPAGVDLSKLPSWVTGKPAPRVVEIGLTSEGLLVGQAESEVGSPYWRLTRCEYAGEAEIELQTDAGTVKKGLVAKPAIPLPHDLQRIVVRTPREELTLTPIACPPWAAGIGRDRYGLFADVDVEGVAFTLRWIPPGEFLMGSPADEPERYDDEGPQHRVRFAQGFWLAETACAQALWRAVTGKNPSRFQGGERPVENVSWDDVQRFIEQINRRKPGLELRLPSEAEWEYACRAGTETPFWFGSELTTEKANYNGSYPYADGPKGEFRKETVPVKTFRRNPWGLYQMHGNVWEWCEDQWHGNYGGAPEDGTAWMTVGDKERAVLRGGSWFSSGRALRSACRNLAPRASTDLFDVNYGFRLARGPELQPGPDQPRGAAPTSRQRERGTSS